MVHESSWESSSSSSFSSLPSWAQAIADTKENTSADNSVTGKSFFVEANPTAPSSTASFESDFENSLKASIQEPMRPSEEYEEMELQLESK